MLPILYTKPDKVWYNRHWFAMSKKSHLLEALPFPVEETLKRLGADLRTARTRRGLTIQAAADKVGVSRFAVMDAERGKPSTGIAIYLAMLWAYDLLDKIAGAIDPASDHIGLALMRADQKKRVRPAETLSDDF